MANICVSLFTSGPPSAREDKKQNNDLWDCICAIQHFSLREKFLAMAVIIDNKEALVHHLACVLKRPTVKALTVLAGLIHAMIISHHHTLLHESQTFRIPASRGVDWAEFRVDIYPYIIG